MDFEIVEEPCGFELVGRSAPVVGDAFASVGMRLMEEVFANIAVAGAESTGIIHWVYLPEGQMFVGLELVPGSNFPSDLEPLAFEIPRSLRHLHVGPYHDLPAKWKALEAELEALGESSTTPSLEVYGHHSEDPARQETMIIIALEPSRGD
ncbi:MAG: hypothetical protein SFX72_15400 [Isosphaeraceae bacterium]|nr:hypothetical protein [Isosphaeraceae bacterium]